jgi:hypothetical protein
MVSEFVETSCPSVISCSGCQVLVLLVCTLLGWSIVAAHLGLVLLDAGMQLCVVRGVSCPSSIQPDLLMFEVVIAAGKTPLWMFNLVMDVVRE